MTYSKTLFSSTAVALALTANAAFADIKAQDVWSDWQAYMSSFGYEMQSRETTSGDTLMVEDLKMNMSFPEGAFGMDIGTLKFTNRADGTVLVEMPAKMPIRFDFKIEEDEAASGLVTTDTSGLVMVVSGTPSEMTYQYSATSMAMKLAELVVEGAPVNFGTAEVTMTGLTGSQIMKIGNMRDMVQDLSMGALNYNIDIAVPEEDVAFAMQGQLSNLSFDGKGGYPTGGFDPQDMYAMLEAGFNFVGGFSYDSSSTQLTMTEDGQPFNSSSSSEGGRLSVAMDAGQLTYSAAAKGLKSLTNTPEIPFPIEINAANAGFDLQMPISAMDTPQDYKLGILLGDFTTSDMLWGMIDPMGQLPRDPATLQLDLSGKATLGFDLLDPEQMEAMERGEVSNPGAVNSVNVNALELSIAGASLTGDGGFEIDNNDTTTFQGMPKPVGEMRLNLSGANGLLDKLVAMGLLPEEQAMGARMMMGLFAVPGEGEDTLKSTIVVNEEGHVLANGQRLR